MKMFTLLNETIVLLHWTTDFSAETTVTAVVDI